ncbi:fibrinogen C domain-containing protein 1-like [Uranotaenia lowii]|uniref:fibrinogen C domain-containing protein 1-like n=1 Tax=Uranotaenia lowii TaxID=190385 RepID=UPI00247874F4|nr:fibrinogen C domain-containing protein 1-like [Uranotaenia lowii]
MYRRHVTLLLVWSLQLCSASDSGDPRPCDKKLAKPNDEFEVASIKSPVKVQCEQSLESGGWIVIHSRFDGTVDFYRTWNDYKNGFGELTGEFWLGFDVIHAVTSLWPCELMVTMVDYSGTEKFAKYSKFAVGDENDNFQLTSLGVYSGTAGDSLKKSLSGPFGTSDRSVRDKKNCAVNYHAAWWHANPPKCDFARFVLIILSFINIFLYILISSNLNGLYPDGIERGISWNHMMWKSFTDDTKGLKTVKMMIRPIDPEDPTTTVAPEQPTPKPEVEQSAPEAKSPEPSTEVPEAEKTTLLAPPESLQPEDNKSGGEEPEPEKTITEAVITEAPLEEKLDPRPPKDAVTEEPKLKPEATRKPVPVNLPASVDPKDLAALEKFSNGYQCNRKRF